MCQRLPVKPPGWGLWGLLAIASASWFFFASFLCVPLLLISKHTRKQLSIFFFCLCSEKPKALLLPVSHGFLSGSDAHRPLPSEAPRH